MRVMIKISSICQSSSIIYIMISFLAILTGIVYKYDYTFRFILYFYIIFLCKAPYGDINKTI